MKFLGTPHPHDNLKYHELLQRKFPNFPIRYKRDSNVTELRKKRA